MIAYFTTYNITTNIKSNGQIGCAKITKHATLPDVDARSQNSHQQSTLRAQATKLQDGLITRKTSLLKIRMQSKYGKRTCPG